MTKELFVSSSPHETKVAVLEDDQLVEVYYERESDVGLVGSIYKGRVSRVLPGMQSAFVNIGLERDAFLYVSDFVEDEEEYDKIFSEAEARATRYVETGQVAPSETVAPALAPQPPVSEMTEPAAAPAPTVAAAPETDGAVAVPPPARPSDERPESRRHDHRRGRRRRRGRDFRFSAKPETHERPADRTFEILPGESLAKYRETGTPAAEAGLTENAQVEVGRSEAQAEPPSEARGDIAAETPATAGVQEAEGGEVDVADAGASRKAVARSEETASLTASPAEPVMTDHPAATAAETAPRATIHELETEEDSAVIFSPAHIYRLVDSGPLEQPSSPLQSKESDKSGPAVAEAKPAPSLEHPIQLEATLGVPQTPEESEAGLESEEVDLPEDGLEVETEGEDSEGPLETAENRQPAGAEVEGQSGSVPEQVGGAIPSSSEGAAEPAGKKYALREPYQRPRFAPRRRRGRRGIGGRRPERYEPSRPGNNQPVQISDLLKEGQEIIVQIAKEPLGTKGARITSHIALPGRYLVFMPTIDHIGVSRKITSEEERYRLRNHILEHRGSLTGGFIVRTAAAGRSEDEFKADLKFLATLWNETRSKAEHVKAPALLHRDLDLVKRVLRDILSPDFKQVRVDSEVEYERCVDFVSHCQPSLVGHVKLYTRDTPLFEEFGIQQEVDKALKPKVWLKSGGYIVINQTEALVAIDVNTGKYVGKTNRLEDTIVKTNIDAVNEIVRQIRLRDLGGIIVIDFIDMDERKNRMKVVQALEEALRRDRAPTKILSFNDFGLVAVTRKRVKQSLERTLSQHCTYCSGSGWIKSVTTVCYEIMGEVKKMARQLDSDTITLRVHPDVAYALKSKQGALLSELEALTRKDIIVKGDPTVHQERFEIY